MTNTTPPVLEYSRLRRRRRRFVGTAVILLLLYIGAYVALRASHKIMHYHDMEGDLIDTEMGTRIPGLAAFRPLMWAEQKLWHLRKSH